MNECVSLECIFNDKLHKGMCVGVSGKTKSYSKDVIRMCWVEKKPTPNAKCDVNMQAQMTPREAVGIGVALIRSSVVGEALLNKVEIPVKQEKEGEEKNANTSPNS